MPELPEVETVKQGLAPHFCQQAVARIIIRQPQLRWPIPKQLKNTLPGQTCRQIERRGKYLLCQFDTGHLIIHLGMSGKLQVIKDKSAAKKHDHVDIILKNGDIVRYNDPRRFGAMLWTDEEPQKHPLLAKLGPEPLTRQFNAKQLACALQKKRIPIKQAIMDHHTVVGVGNIYASESLFKAGIHPLTPANTVTEQSLKTLVQQIKHTLKQAIKAGGTTLKDFTSSEGKPGYFQQQLFVYGREGEACLSCNNEISACRTGGRSTFFCKSCQK